MPMTKTLNASNGDGSRQYLQLLLLNALQAEIVLRIRKIIPKIFEMDLFGDRICTFSCLNFIKSIAQYTCKTLLLYKVK